MLTKRDRERHRNALKDLKDYEIYKEVMETAMVRLQSELELYAKENMVRFGGVGAGFGDVWVFLCDCDRLILT